MNGDTGGVNLNVRRISKVSTLAIALNGSRAVTAHSIGREEIGITITTSSDNHSVCREALQLASNEVLGDDTTGTTVNDHHIFHLIASIEFHLTSLHLTAQRAIGSEQQLLTRLLYYY